MIKYALKCRGGHEFESWFASAASFEDQAAQGRVACPMYHTADVIKAIMAPALTTHAHGAQEDPAHAGKAGIALVDKKRSGIFAEIRAFRDYILGLTEDVGARFPDEARKITEGIVADRPIRGHARIDEAKELLDEGICVLPIPLLPEDLN